MTKLLTPKQVAAMLCVTTSCLQRWRLKGKGPDYHHIGHSIVRYQESEVWKFIEEHRVSLSSQARERACGAAQGKGEK